VPTERQKEIFRQQLPERATYLSAQPQGDKFLVATEKAFYLLQPAEGSSFTLKRLKEGVFHWPALSPDGQQVAAGKGGGKEREAASVVKKLSPDEVEKGPGTALVILDISSGQEREMLSLLLDRRAPDTTYRIITSVGWSPDGKRVVAGTTSPADPRIEWLVSVDVANGQVHGLLETTQLYTPPGSFTPDGKYYLFSQGKPDYREFLGEGDQYTGPRVPEPFWAKIGLLELESGKISYLQNIPPDLNAYWPLTELKTDVYFHDSDRGGYIYFLDQDHYNWVRFPPEGSLPATGVCRVSLQGGQPERLFEVRGLVSYAVIL
jgi:Tol biopolymer transport system component